MSTDERIDAVIDRNLRDYNSPPATPREEIWAAMQMRHKVVEAPLRRPPILRWPAVAAAILLLGIGIGRIAEQGPSIASRPEAGIARIDRGAIFKAAALPVLGRAEVLLTGLRSGPANAAAAEDLKPRAEDLLCRTRLLIDSPASDDPELRDLLLDLELVLARFTRYAAGEEGEAEWIRRDIENRTLLPRIRWRLPAGGAPVTL